MSKNPILVYVEDDPLSREVMKMLVVRRLGFSLTVFEDSQDIIARLEALPAKPNMILLDIHMRPHNGFAVLEMLRAHPSYAAIKVIAVTASVMNEEMAMLESSGFNGAIAKPLDQTFFPEFLDRAMQGEEIWHVS
ncbi:MAG: response regulator [Anaerolineae bacterium]|nr:response regulator [Anaerolineae bacterium]